MTADPSSVPGAGGDLEARLRERVAEAMNRCAVPGWEGSPFSGHDRHRFYAGCQVCEGNVAALADAAVAAVLADPAVSARYAPGWDDRPLDDAVDAARDALIAQTGMDAGSPEETLAAAYRMARIAVEAASAALAGSGLARVIAPPEDMRTRTDACGLDRGFGGPS